MANLLLVTDHIFSQYKNQLFDNYCFGQEFFDDYLSCFDNVQLVARVRLLSNLSSGLKEINSNRVHFNSLPNINGMSWIMKSKKLTIDVLNNLNGKFDYTIVRVPSQSGYWAAKYSFHKKIPLMVEIIGDPSESIAHINYLNPLYRIFSIIEMNKLKKITQTAKCTSYVNKEPLSLRFPTNSIAQKDYISSIRLSKEKILNNKQFNYLNKINIIHVGSLIPVKRQIDLLKCAKVLKNKNFNFHLDIIGGGPLLAKLEVLSRKMKITNDITFHGHISDDKILISHYDRAHLFVLTSASEGLPRSMIEAMARGLPVISTNVGGIPEIVSSEKLVGVGDYLSLAEKIITLFTNKLDTVPIISHKNILIAHRFEKEILSQKRKALYKYLRD